MEQFPPSQITICGLVGGDRLKLIDLDTTKPRWTFVHQVCRELHRRRQERHDRMALFFGAPTGFVINYDPDRAVRYDLAGKALEILPVRLGETRVSVGGRWVSRVFELG